MKTVHVIALPPGSESVLLYDGAEIIGGWLNVGDNKSANTAAEVIKAMMPEIPLIARCMESHQKAAKEYWDAVQTVKGQRDTDPGHWSHAIRDPLG